MYVIYNNLTDEFKSHRNSNKSQIPPRRQRITEAIRNNSLLTFIFLNISGFEDIRSLLNIHYVDEGTINCDICGHLFKSGIFKSRYKFSCQLCNETFCSECHYRLTLFKGSIEIFNLILGTELQNPITVSSCKECYIYYRVCLILTISLMRTLEDSVPEDANLLNIFNLYSDVLEIYKDLNTKLLQLRGYLKLLNIHTSLKEKLPEGTRNSIVILLTETTNSKKKLSNIKSNLKNFKGTNVSITTSHIIKSLNTLLTTILYKIVPEFNGVKNKLALFEDYDK
ncbi:uncharacterized protein TA05040 [Theileria annulata]|uniref:Uncharacterized protein n=1 Tax=Theileria annulata TaxID=5874 RepID=Q4UBQ6_THEAN|nr:uncharacterized protein TA05040 [Theileria annulata]CAI75745.1 hypothetical protein TA05040 [Theileria annulata]|eukprot:XP_955221.1 hypothetical protein TA05040 [Theileria annulata]